MSGFINITRRERGLEIPITNKPLGFEGKAVSHWSKYQDSVWILSTSSAIHWLHLPENQTDISREAFDSLMGPTKQLAFLLMTEEELRPVTIYHIVQSIKMFTCWMLSQTIPITRFCNVPPNSINEYLELISRRQPLRTLARATGTRRKTATVRRHVRALLRLYQYRDRIGDGLQDCRILLDTTAVQTYEQYQSKTEPIPDEELQNLLVAAVRFMTANWIKTVHRFNQFVANEKVIEVHEALVNVGNDELTRRRLKKVAELIKTVLKPDSTSSWESSSAVSLITLALKTKTSVGDCAICLRQNRDLGDMYRRRRRSRTRKQVVNLQWRDLKLKIRFLQNACLIIIAASTGMRLGELLALQPGCLVKRKVRGAVLYWVKSTLLKTSLTHEGESATWLCGELAAKAIVVLQHLHSALPSNTESKVRSNISIPDSLFRTYVWDGVTLEARPVLNSIVLQDAMNVFVKELDLNVGYIHSHRFRRTFARNIARWTETPILALQRHFKHWSLLMTDYYVGTDSQLMEMFFEAQMEASRMRLRQILSGECGGPGGLLLQKRLAKMLDLGELPASFRGRIRPGHIEALVEEMSRDGILAYKCADFTTCLYVPAVAKCGDDGPKEHECHPTECANSHILLEDVPFYLRNITHNSEIYDQLSSTEKHGPFGLFIMKRIRNDKTAIRPLARLYKEKLRRQREQYKVFSEADAMEAPSLELQNRINEEAKILEGLLSDG